jgi:hypothetical protein
MLQTEKGKEKTKRDEKVVSAASRTVQGVAKMRRHTQPDQRL